MISNDQFNNFDFYLNNLDQEKNRLDILIQKKIKLVELLKNIDWKELEVEIDSYENHLKPYKITFGTEAFKLEEEIKELLSFFDHLKTFSKEIVYGNESTDLSCRFNFDTNFNRIHISDPKGLPVAFRNLGLAKKIYRAILSKEEYIMSEDRSLASTGKLIWNSLRKSELFYTFFSKTQGYVFASNTSGIKVIEILESKINRENAQNILLDEIFTHKYPDLVQNSIFNPN